MKSAVRVFVLLCGLALFAWFFHRVGPAEIWDTMSRLGWRAPLVLIPLACVYMADTTGWRYAFGHAFPRHLSPQSLYRVRWCGESVNNVLPSVGIGGEAVKVYLLHKRGVRGKDATASVIVGRTLQTSMQVVFIGLGSAGFLHIGAGTPALRKAMLIVLVLSCAAVAIMFWLQRHGVFTLLLRLGRLLKMTAAHIEARAERLIRIDQQVRDFYRHDHLHFALSAGAYLGGWLLDTMDIFLVAWLLGIPMYWVQALAIEAFIGVARLMTAVVPGSLGVQESGIVLMCQLAGLPGPFGPAYAIIRRGRDLAFACIGWGMLYAEETTLHGLAKRVAEDTMNET